MKRLSHVHTLLTAVSLLVAPLLWADQLPDSERQQELIYLLHQDCGSCHGMRLSGGLGPSILADDLQNKPDEYLRLMIAKGNPDNAMPPWGNMLSESEIEFLVDRLRQRPAPMESNE